MSSKKLVIIACLCLVIICAPIAYYLSTKNQATIIGIVNGEKVYEKDLSTLERQNLFDANSQVYLSAENILAKRYFQDIIAKYKKKRNIDDDLAAQQAYIEENIKITDAQVKEFITQNADNPQLKGKSYEEQRALVEPYLMQQEIQTFFDNLVQQAVADGKLNVLLVKKPVPIATDIQIDADDPSKGPADAPITMVEFADYQCPYCNSAQPIIQALLQKYEGKIRFVFKNFPLIQIHSQAVNAAIAAKCAQEQDKFWEMHDKLFTNYNNLSNALYLSLATELNLDLDKFKKCQDNQNLRTQIMDDIKYGQALGITATPAFYINGNLIMGAQSISVFERIINAELEKN